MTKLKNLLGGMALALAACAHGGATETAAAATAPLWDAEASAEATHAMHVLHDAWNNMDVATVDSYLSKDGFLTTFELNEDGTPVELRSRADVIAFLQRGFADYKSSGSTTVATPVVDMTCQATATMAVCTEECDITVSLANGQREVTPHRGTSTLRKGPDGWKFTHWHVSAKGPKYVLDEHGNRLANASVK
jgi:ketosteroid isomerase-like protein